MADIMLVKEAAALWNLTERRVSDLCNKGKIEGAIKNGHIWLIPADAKKPVDQRIKSGAYKKIKDRIIFLCRSASLITALHSQNTTILIKH